MEHIKPIVDKVMKKLAKEAEESCKNNGLASQVSRSVKSHLSANFHNYHHQGEVRTSISGDHKRIDYRGYEGLYGFNLEAFVDNDHFLGRVSFEFDNELGEKIITPSKYIIETPEKHETQRTGLGIAVEKFLEEIGCETMYIDNVADSYITDLNSVGFRALNNKTFSKKLDNEIPIS